MFGSACNDRLSGRFVCGIRSLWPTDDMWCAPCAPGIGFRPRPVRLPRMQITPQRPSAPAPPSLASTRSKACCLTRPLPLDNSPNLRPHFPGLAQPPWHTCKDAGDEDRTRNRGLPDLPGPPVEWPISVGWVGDTYPLSLPQSFALSLARRTLDSDDGSRVLTDHDHSYALHTMLACSAVSWHRSPLHPC